MNPAVGSRYRFYKLDLHRIKLRPVPRLDISGVLWPSDVAGFTGMIQSPLLGRFSANFRISRQPGRNLVTHAVPKGVDSRNEAGNTWRVSRSDSASESPELHSIEVTLYVHPRGRICFGRQAGEYIGTVENLDDRRFVQIGLAS